MTQGLQYYIHDEADALRFELAGSLSGAGTESIYHAWKTALSVLEGRPVIMDITFVGEADENGRALLRLWHRRGARFVARSTESRALAEELTGEPLPAPRAKHCWRQRLRGILFRRPAAHVIAKDASGIVACR